MSGLPTTGAASIRDEFQTGYTALALFMFIGPSIISLLFEAPLLVAIDRFPRARVAALALLVMAAAMGWGAFASNPWMFSIALALFSLGSGVTCGITQAALIDGDPQRREERMAQWTLAGVIGDLTAPLLLIATAAIGLGWRAAMIVSAVLTALFALPIARAELPRIEEKDEEEGETTERPTWSTALANRRLLLWLFACSLCGLLDEPLVAFAALLVRDRLGGDVVAQGAVIGAFTIGGTLGLLAMPHLLRRLRPLTLLVLCSLGSALSYGAWLAAGSIASSVAWLFVAGIFTSTLYPLTKAQAYRALPERSSLVAAASALFTPIDLFLPLVLGLLADRAGVRWALALLGLQPVMLFVIGAIARRSAPK